MIPHDAYHQRRRSSKQLILSLVIVSRSFITAKNDTEREKLWNNHYNDLLSPPSSAESNTDTDNEELPTGLHFRNLSTDSIDMD
jgi:hypothetical protein